MGGGGAIKLGMLFPDIFSVVYGSSPGPLAVTKELGSTGKGFKRVQNIKTREELLKDGNFMANALLPWEGLTRPILPNHLFIAIYLLHTRVTV